MRILGVDCGTELTGYGVIDSDGRSHRLVAADVIRTKTNIPLEYRLAHIGKELRQVIQSFTPQTVAVEAVFHSINAKSALKLAHVRGVALYLAAEANVPVAEYSPLEVKVSVVGYGRAEKHQVEMMVQSLLGIDRKFTSYDATDALAVAICHGARMNFSAAAGDYR